MNVQTALLQRRVDPPRMDASLKRAYEHCERMVRSHYENFPVASLFIPKHLRREIAAMYAFARTADDFADEGNMSEGDRLAKLDDWQKKLSDCYEGKADHPIFCALADSVARKSIPKQLLADLLTAFRMDVTRHRFRTYGDLLFYCRHSANPVGRLVLHVFGGADERSLALSDSICTALQLTNFWQDVAVDWAKGRMYLPLEDVERFGYTESALSQHMMTGQFRSLMKFEVERTHALFEDGKSLLDEVMPGLRLELRVTWHGGRNILRKIEAAGYDVLTQRVRNTFADKLRILTNAIVHSGA